MNEGERVNVNKVRAFEEVCRQELMVECQAVDANKQTHDIHGSCAWHRPPIISDLPVVVIHGVNSTEKEVQHLREQSVLQSVYFTKDVIPDTAMEAEIEPPTDVEELKIIPLHDDTGGDETSVDFSKTSMPKPGGMALLQPTGPTPSPQFSLPPDIANILGNKAQELTSDRQPAQLPTPQPNAAGSFPGNIQQVVNNIIDQNPATPPNEAMKTQSKMMMESGPIQIQAWASGQPAGPVNWAPPPPPGPPRGGLLPHPNMPPASMMRPPMHGPRGGNHYYPGSWVRGGPPPYMMGGPGGPRPSWWQQGP